MSRFIVSRPDTGPTTFKIIKQNNDNLVKKLADWSGVDNDIVYNLIQYTKCMVKPETGLVDEQIFMAVLSKSFGLMDRQIVKKTYEAMRNGNTKGACIEEVSKLFCCYYSKKTDIHIDHVFKVYDVDKNGTIEALEVQMWLKNLQVIADEDFDNMDPVQDLINITCDSVGFDNVGYMTVERFRAKVKENPLVMQILGPCMPSREMLKKFLDSIIGKSLLDVKREFGDLRQQLLFELPDKHAPKHYPVMLELP